MGRAPGRDNKLGLELVSALWQGRWLFDGKAFQDCQEKSSFAFLIVGYNPLVLFGFCKNIFYCKLLVLVDTCLNKIYEMVYSKGPWFPTPISPPCLQPCERGKAQRGVSLLPSMEENTKNQSRKLVPRNEGWGERVHLIITCRLFFMSRSVDKLPLSPRTDCSACGKGCWAVSH